MIILAKKDRKNEKLLAIKNVDKIVIAKVVEVLNAINFNYKHNWSINNSNMNAARDLRLTNIKKY